MKGEILDNYEPSTNEEVTKSYEHWYDTVDARWCFGGRAQIRKVSGFNLIAPLLVLKRFIIQAGPTYLLNTHATIRRAFALVLIDIRTRYIGQRRNSPRHVVPC